MCGVRGAFGVRAVFGVRGVFVLLLLAFSYWSVISLFIVCKFCGGIFLFNSFLFSMCSRTLSLWCWIRRFRSCLPQLFRIPCHLPLSPSDKRMPGVISGRRPFGIMLLVCSCSRKPVVCCCLVMQSCGVCIV